MVRIYCLLHPRYDTCLHNNMDEYIYQLSSEHHIQDTDTLKESIQTILSDNTDGN